MLIHHRRPTAIGAVATRHTVMGLEIEKMRVDNQGKLSAHPFPEDLSKSHSPHIEREFFTAQIEFALPKTPSVDDNLEQAERILSAASEYLAPHEHLWPYSSPPHLPENPSENLVSTKPVENYDYRKRLCEIYDLRRLMHTGVHLNISFAPHAMQALLENGPFKDGDSLYLHLAQQMILHRWFFTWLFGASPLNFTGYFDNRTLWRPVRSLRSSSLGFPTSINGNYHSLEGYVARIKDGIKTGELEAPAQFYESVRLKSPQGNAPEDLLTNGISHLELRTFDLNPLSPIGVTREQLYLVQALAVHLAMRPPLDDDALKRGLTSARQINERIALEDPRKISCAQDLGLKVLKRLRRFAAAQQLPAAHRAAIDHFIKTSRHPHSALACRTLFRHPMYAR